ncbi:hypothetical protein SLS58_002884 [Diplodia intermedia]|uniref:Uncharacterized protein n=1 Tax=Diplodia intermedia TaxID=856260 RepID=A0ABR3TY18_9PEZI
MSAPLAQPLADPSMLAKIDKLFACNVGHYIDLPQIVVVGDQSSGKSSVLEGLTRLPFPRDSGLCTRFATQITFRRAIAKSISVAVIPGKDAFPDHTDTLRGWKRKDFETLGGEHFAQIMREVQQLMGITQRDGSSSGFLKTFSSDVLSIEVSGPQEEHLTVIDVPGIFQRATKDVTTKEDKEFVRRMVGGYMKNPRSIMLTVVPSNVDVATQLILEMAEEVDKEGQRTLGVLTKPDLVDKGAERSVIDMVEGRSHQLLLGWCLVRNPGQTEIGNISFDRYAAEEGFFRTTTPWNELPKDRVGVTALRARLQEVLARHIRQEFPKVKLEIGRRLKKSRGTLEALGARRDTPAEQSRFLIEMADRFQAIVGKALAARYLDDCFTEHPVLKIATLIVHRSEMLSQDFAKYGHTYEFKDCLGDKDEKDDDSEDDDNLSGYPKGETGTGIDEQEVTTASQSRIYTRRCKDAGELVDVLHSTEMIALPKRRGILDWITGVYDKSRGFELGQFDPSLLATLMKAQSSSWSGLAFGYTSDVVIITHVFIDTLLKSVCLDSNTYQNLKSTIMEHLMDRYQKALSQVKFVLTVERFGIPATQNHYFNENLQKCRQDRNYDAAFAKSFYCAESKGAVVRLSDLKHSRTMSNKEHTVQDLHDILQSYYKVARKRIVDNICMQAVSYHLISGPDTPLRLFSPAFVSRLSDEQLEEIAGEDVLVRKRRARLLKEVEDLQNGRKILG